MIDAQAISDSLGGRRSGRGYLTRCPAHDDREASLSISDGDNGLPVVFCHAGCDSVKEVIPALQARNIWPTSTDLPANSEAITRRKTEREAEEQAGQAAATSKAKELWNKATGDPASHPYAIKKGVPLGKLVKRGRWPQRSWEDALLIPLYDQSGEMMTVQAISPAGDKDFLTGGKTAGCFHPLGKFRGKTGKVLIGEGLATVAAAKEATGYPGVVAVSAGNLVKVAEVVKQLAPKAEIIVIADDDRKPDGSNPGKEAAIKAALAVGGKLAVPDLGKKADAWDVWKEQGPEAVKKMIEEAASPEPATSDTGAMEEIATPLLFDEIDTPDIPPALLPGWLGEYVDALARHTQTPPAMAVMLALSTVATCTAKRFEVSPSDGYHEPLNIWTATALPPASRKTAVVSAMTSPLDDWEKCEATRLAPEIKRTEITRRNLRKRIDKLEKDAANADDRTRRDELSREIEQLESDMPEILHPPRLWTGDTTAERLQSLLVDHNERMAVLADEGGIFEIMAGLYNDGRANLDIFLQGHAGKAVRVDRQSRTAHLDAPALSFGLAIQPAILADFSNGGKRRFRGNGTLARFLFAVPRSNIGRRDVRATYQIPATVAARYHAGLLDLLEITPQVIDGREVPRRLTLTPEALESWQAFAAMIEQRQGTDGDLEAIQDWSGKLPGAALRIAGNFHLVEHGCSPPALIASATIEMALDLCALLIDHAKAAFAMMEADQTTADAKAVYKWIMEEKLARFKTSELWGKFKGRFTGKTDRLEKAVKELQARHIITVETEPTKGRAAKVYIANPLLWVAA